MNRLRGEVPITIGKKKMILIYDYEALELLRTEFGEHGHARLIAATSSLDVKTLSKGIEIGLQAKQPGEITAEQIMKTSPAFKEMQEAVYEAFMCAFYGANGMPEENPRMRPIDRMKKMLNRLFGRSAKRSDAV